MQKNSKVKKLRFSSIQPIDRTLIRCYHPGSEWTLERWQWRGAPHSPKFQHRWNLTIRLFSVISRTLVGGGSYPSAEVQLVYSTAPADWAGIVWNWFGAKLNFNLAKIFLFRLFKMATNQTEVCQQILCDPVKFTEECVMCKEKHVWVKNCLQMSQTWIFHYEYVSRRQFMGWKHTDSPTKKKYQVQRSVKEEMLRVFCDMTGTIIIDFLEKGAISKICP